MSQKLSRKTKFLLEHPVCCFCGGTEPATTLDHVPPKACFPSGLWPEQFEFPSCQRCNHGTSKQDTIFGLYSMLADFNPDNQTAADLNRMAKLQEQIAIRYPEALPDSGSEQPIYRVGHIFTPTPAAFSVAAKPAVVEAMRTAADKLTHAPYYREMKKILTPAHRFFAAMHSIQDSRTELMTNYLKHTLPDFTLGNRSNIPNYGSRFAYMSGCKTEEDFFLFAGQFGLGLLCWGMVLAPGMEPDESHHALKGMNWRNGGSGLGSHWP